MTSSSASTEPLAVKVMRAVLTSRIPAAPDQRQAIEDALLVHDSLCVRVAVGHAECEARCTRSAPVELWSVRVEEERGEEGAQPLPGIFLLNAVRSYVHFSQLSAWLRPQPGGDPPPAAVSYQLLLPSAAAAFIAPPDATLAEHAFPLAADASVASSRASLARRCVVRVSVRYVQRTRPLSPTGFCLQLGRLPTDEWLLPSPLPSPTGHEFNTDGILSAAAVECMRGGKHKASEPDLYSPTGPALKQIHFGEEKEELVIEHVCDGFARENTVIVEEETCMELIEEEMKEMKKKEEIRNETIEIRKEEDKKKELREMIMMRNVSQSDGKKEKNRRGLRRMIGGWEESVLAGVMEERQMPDAGYTLTIVSPSAPPVRLRLATASLADTHASCIARATITEADRVRDACGSAVRKVIKRRGLHVQEKGVMQMSLVNAESTLRAHLSVPYDLTDLPHGARTIVRHRVHLVPKSSEKISVKSPLRYLIQMSMSRDRSGRCFVTGEITVVFSTDASVDGDNVKMDTVTGVAHAAELNELRSKTVTAPYSLKSNLVVI